MPTSRDRAPTGPTRRGKPMLTRQDWATAALDAMGTGGVAAVAVDRLAKTVGATRGSFYWHFRDRDELIGAALELWEHQSTTELVPQLEKITDPAARLQALFRQVYEKPVDTVEIVLAASADEPRVAPVLARVTRTRLDVLRRIFVDLGLDADDADARAWLAYAFYIGHHQLGQNHQLTTERPNRLDRVIDLLTSPHR